MSETKTRIREKRDPYCCIRCDYSTPHKPSMRRHFYKLNKSCPAIKNNIELTIEIKEHILANRIYIIPKPEKIKKDIPLKEKNEISKIVRDEYLHFIYLVWPELSILGKVNIFKIGLTIIKNETQEIIRLKTYGVGSEIIMIVQCVDANKMEKKIKDKFNQVFKRTHGLEYFSGNKELMQELILEILLEEKKLLEWKKI